MDALIAIRFVHFAATLLTSGTLLFALLMPHDAPAAFLAALRKLATATLLIAILSGVAWWCLIAATILDVPVTEVWRDGWAVLTSTRFGQVAGARLVLALLLLAALRWRSSTPAQAVLALAFVALPALVGHSGAKPGLSGTGFIFADMAHLIAAAAWLGGLPAFALLLAGRSHDVLVVQTTRRFGQIALASVAVLAVSGLVNAWHLLNGPGDFLNTPYGRTLSIKLALVATMLALAGGNRFWLTPALPAARRMLTRSVCAETILGLGIVGLVAALGTLPPGGHMHVEADSIPDGASFVHIHGVEAMADVTVDPGRVGRVSITVRVAREDFSNFPARAVSVALDGPSGTSSRSIEGIAVHNDGLWRIHPVDVPVAGTWTVRVFITPVMGAPLVLDAPLVIAP